MAHSDIDNARLALFGVLAGERGELDAHFVKGRPGVPATRARVVEGDVRILLSPDLLQRAELLLDEGDAARPNLTESMLRWLREEPGSLRGVSSEEGQWVHVSPAANFYRWVHSNQDYPPGGTKNKGTAINGFTQWTFLRPGEDSGVKLLVKGSDIPAVEDWLADPEGPPPLPAASPLSRPRGMADPPLVFEPVPGAVELWTRTHAQLDLPPAETVYRWAAAFRERFPVSRLERLEGRELLHELHGRESQDCMMFWLEFKSDDQFDNRTFGSIRGGSALKFQVYQSVEDGLWRTGSSRHMQVISEEAAAGIAERQRDQLVAAVAVVQDLPGDPFDERYATLQRDIEAAAPDIHQLGFLHKALFLYAPDRIDDYQSAAWRTHMLASMGITPPEGSRHYAAARALCAALQVFRQAVGEPLPMRDLSLSLNKAYGRPGGHWRIGTGGAGEHWPAMRDGGFVAIGWGQLGDLSDFLEGLQGGEGTAALKKAMAEHWADDHPTLVGRSASQVWKFYDAMQVGERVYAAYGQRIFGVGVIEGGYEYMEDELAVYPHRRRVRWLSTDPFKAETKRGLRTTVYDMVVAPDFQAQAARHLGAAAPAEEASPVPDRLARALAPIDAQLDRKGQVILYGPPGTGKTYHALQVAEERVARSVYQRSWGQLAPEQRQGLKGRGDPGAQRIWMCTFHPAFGYEDFVEGLRAVPVSGGLDFRPEPGLFRRICERAAAHRSQEFVLIIDEFNRGDSPRIFGELLTLLELDKREKVPVELPLSRKAFTVPGNVRILATMNTADRSISLLDAALRRRFGFVEYLPDAAVLGEASVEGLHLGGLLRVLNTKLLATLGEAARNLQVGHAYLMDRAKPISSVSVLKNALRYDIFPLLQEYCAEDAGSLATILGPAFYDQAGQRFVDQAFEDESGDAFISALIEWDPKRLAVAEEEPDSDPADEDEDGE